MAREAGDIDMSSDATYDRNASTLFFTELFRGRHLIFTRDLLCKKITMKVYQRNLLAISHNVKERMGQRFNLILTQVCR